MPEAVAGVGREGVEEEEEFAALMQLLLPGENDAGAAATGSNVDAAGPASETPSTPEGRAGNGLYLEFMEEFQAPRRRKAKNRQTPADAEASTGVPAPVQRPQPPGGPAAPAAPCAIPTSARPMPAGPTAPTVRGVIPSAAGRAHLGPVAAAATALAATARPPPAPMAPVAWGVIPPAAGRASGGSAAAAPWGGRMPGGSAGGSAAAISATAVLAPALSQRSETPAASVSAPRPVPETALRAEGQPEAALSGACSPGGGGGDWVDQSLCPITQVRSAVCYGRPLADMWRVSFQEQCTMCTVTQLHGA